MLGVRRAGLLAAVIAAVTVGLVADAASAPHESMKPKRPFVTANALTARATVGSYCVAGTAEPGEPVGGVCADAAYPLDTRGRLPVEPRDRVRLRFPDNPRIEDDVKAVRVALVRRQGERYRFLDWGTRARSVRGTQSRFRFRLPQRLRRANVLDISVRYVGGGDANSWAGLRAESRG